MTVVTTAYAITAASFFLGVALSAVLYRELDGSAHQRWLAALAIIPGFAGLMYVPMALGLGNIEAAGGTLVVPRYVDWLVTTPLLVGFVGYVAGASRRSIIGVMIADALMILVGMGAVVSTGTLKWVLFGGSSLFHVSLFFYLYVVFPRNAPEEPMRYGLFTLLKNHIGLLWLAYPFVWLTGPAALGYTTAAATSLTFAFLDVLAKVPYVYFFYARRHVFEGVESSASSAAGVAAD